MTYALENFSVWGTQIGLYIWARGGWCLRVGGFGAMGQWARVRVYPIYSHTRRKSFRMSNLARAVLDLSADSVRIGLHFPMIRPRLANSIRFGLEKRKVNRDMGLTPLESMVYDGFTRRIK